GAGRRGEATFSWVIPYRFYSEYNYYKQRPCHLRCTKQKCCPDREVWISRWSGMRYGTAALFPALNSRASAKRSRNRSVRRKLGHLLEARGVEPLSSKLSTQASTCVAGENI